MRLLFALLTLSAVGFSQAVRIDPNPVFTIAGNTPPGAYTPVLAIPGAAVSINTTTFTDSTATTACPSNAQVVLPGASGCVPTANQQGSFGFWVMTGTYLYTITIPNGQVFGPFPVSAGGSGGGGGGCSPSGPAGAVQFLNGSNCAGSGNFVWNNSTQLLTVTALNSSSPAIVAGTGYIQSDRGFLATPGSATTYNSIQAPGGGVAALSGTFVNYVNSGSRASDPSPTTGDTINPGAMYWSTANSCEKVYNGSAFVCLAAGASGVNSITGTAKQVIASSPTGAVTLSLPQNIDTAAAVTFGSVTSAVYNSTNTGSGVTFQNSNSNFIVNGNGDITASGNHIQTGYVTSSTWIGLKQDTSTPGTTPGGGFSALNYKGGVSGLEVNLYDVVHSAWTVVDLGAAGTGISSINGQTGTAQTIAGTTKQITVTTSTDKQTLSLPQNIDTGAAVTFNTLTATAGATSAVFNATATGTSITFQNNNNNFFVDGKGNISSACASGCTAGVDGANVVVGGYLTAGTWVGLHNTVSAPATSPGGGFSALSYKSGSVFWFYNTTAAAWQNFDVSSIGGGVTSVNGQVGPAITIAGTANQVIATTGSNTVTLSLPQSINTGASVTFGNVTSAGVFQSTVAAGVGLGFQIANGLGTPFSVNGSGDISGNGSINMVGASAAGAPYKVNGTAIVDASRNATFNTVTSTGAVVSNATGTSNTFTNSNFNFLVNGNGFVTAAGTYTSTTLGGGFSATGSTRFDSFQNLGQGGMSARNFTATTYIQAGQSGGVPTIGVFGSNGDAFHPGAMYWDTTPSAFRLYTSASGFVSIINSTGAFIGPGVDVGGSGINAGGYNVNGGFIGQTWTIGFSSPFTINGAGAFTSLVFRGGVLVSAI